MNDESIDEAIGNADAAFDRWKALISKSMTAVKRQGDDVADPIVSARIAQSVSSLERSLRNAEQSHRVRVDLLRKIRTASSIED